MPGAAPSARPPHAAGLCLAHAALLIPRAVTHHRPSAGAVCAVRRLADSSLFPSGGHLPLTQAVPGNLRTAPGGPAGPLYGRTEHGRFRGARH